MIAMAKQRNCEPLSNETIRGILWSLRFSCATLEEIAEDHGAKFQQVDYLRRKFEVKRIKEPHRCPKCNTKLETAECLRCHLVEAANAN